MVNKVRETTIPAITYLGYVKMGDISENQDVQRRFCSDNSFINGIAATVLTGDYLPPIILGEIPIGQGMVQQYIVDAMQRTSALMKIRFENYKITSTIENSVIEYQAKKRDMHGKICRDELGNIIWDQCTFDIKNKTFNDFPEELKIRFDTFQLRVVTHQNCTMQDISRLIRRYNNHKGMNASQKAFTYLDLFARKVKTIASENRFFKDTIKFSETENKKGTYEKAICEATMSVFHIEDWKKNSKQMSIYLNNNSNDDEFDTINEYANRINQICDDEFQDIFVMKDIPVWFAVFDKFIRLNVEDNKFFDFIKVLKEKLHSKEINGDSYDSLDEATGTKDKKLIIKKIEVIESLMMEFLGLNHNDIIQNETSKLEDFCEENDIDTLNFVKENVDAEITSDDLSFYNDCLDDLTLNVDNTSVLLNTENYKSLISIVAYSFKEDIDLDDWFVDFFSKNNTYIKNQKENYTYMVNDVNKFMKVDFVDKL